MEGRWWFKTVLVFLRSCVDYFWKGVIIVKSLDNISKLGNELTELDLKNIQGGKGHPWWWGALTAIGKLEKQVAVGVIDNNIILNNK